MSGKARGQVAIRRRRGVKRYALRFATAGKRHYLALGSEREGWSLGSAERVLLTLRGGFLTGDPGCPEGGCHGERPGG
jgi:hypothetical protein